MFGRRLAGVAMIVAGLGMVLGGVERTVVGGCTASGPFTPAVCIHAHQEPPQLVRSRGSDCQVQYVVWCVPGNPLNCDKVSGYGYAIPGECEFVIEEQGEPTCTQDFAATAVRLEFHDAQCIWHQGACQCVWGIGGVPPVSVEVCDCRGS